MIKFRSYKGAGAFTYDKWSLDLADQGMIFVRGENQDTGTEEQGSNGSGKSTLFEVLEHLGYSKTSKGVKKNGIVSLNPSIDEGFFAELEIERDDGLWLVRQSRNHVQHGTGVKVFKWEDDEWKDSTPKNNAGKDYAQQFVTELFGLSHKEFHGCVYLAQGESHTLINGTPSERQNYLSSLFGLDRFDELKDKVNSNLKRSNQDLAELAKIEGELASTVRSIEDLDTIENLDFHLQTLDEAQQLGEEKLAQADKTKKDCLLKLQQAAQRTVLLQEIEENGYDKEDLEDDLDQVDDELKSCKAQERSLTEACQVWKSYEKCKNRLDDLSPPDEDLEVLQTKLEKLTTERERLKALKPQVERRQVLETKLADMPNIEIDIEEEAKRKQQCIDSLANARSQITLVKETLTKYTQLDTAICPTCGQDVDQEHVQNEVDSLNEKLQVQRKIVTSSKQDLKEIEDRISLHEKQSKIKVELNNLPDIKDFDVQLKKVRTELKITKADFDCAKDYAQVQEELSRIELPDTPHEECQSDLDQLLKRIQKAADRRDGIKQALTLLAKAEAIEEIDEDLHARKLSIAEETVKDLRPALMTLASKTALMKEQRRSRLRLEKEQAKLEAELSNLDKLKHENYILQTLSKAVPKLKKRQLHQVVSAIRDVLPRYTSIMYTESPPVHFVLDEDKEDAIDIQMERTLYDPDTGHNSKIRIPVAGLSGGEKKRLSVSLLFTLHDLLAPSKRIDLLILDEVDDGLDSLGVSSLMSIVKHCKETYGTVIMTSQRAEISGTAFDKVWTVKKKNNISEILIQG